MIFAIGRVSEIMRKKPIMMTAERLSMNDVFPRFVSAKIAESVSDKTVKMYHQHLHCISNIWICLRCRHSKEL